MTALWGAGAAALLARQSDREGARVGATAAAAESLLHEAQAALLREAGALARDPAIVDFTGRGDAAIIERGAPTRSIGLTATRPGDLILVRDAGGDTLAQAPAAPRVTIPDLFAPPTPTTLLRMLRGQPWLLGIVPVHWTDATTVGSVVIGRRIADLGRLLAALPGRPALVVAAGDRLIGGTLPEAPASGWLAAVRTGGVDAAGVRWAVRPLGGALGLWVAVPPAPGGDGRLALLLGLLAALGLGLGGVVGGAWLVRRRGSPGRAKVALDRALDALHIIAGMTSSDADLATTAGRWLNAACSVTGLSAGAVCRFDARAGTLTPLARRGVDAAELTSLCARALGAGHAGEALRTGRLVVTDLTRSTLLEPALRDAARAAGHALQIALPIPAPEQPWSVLILLGPTQRRPGPGEIAALEVIARQAGLALSRASLVAEARDKGRRLETVARLAGTLTAAMPLDEVLQRVADAAVEAFAASESRVWLMDAGDESLSLAAHSGVRAPVGGPGRLHAGEGLAGIVVASRAALTVADLRQDPRLRDVERARAAGVVSLAGVPMILDDRVLGALSLGTRERHEFNDEELALLQSLAGHAAVAIDNARRFADEAQRRAQLAAVLEINKRIAAAESTEALLGAIAEEAARLLEVDNAGFRLVDGDELVLAGLAGTARQTMVRERIKIGESFSGWVVREGRTIAAGTDEIPSLIPEHRAADERLGYVQHLGVPLRAGARIIGVLAFRARRQFTARDCDLAEAFAGQAALALEHTRLYREASRQAERMAALADVERLLAETLEPDVVARRIAETVRGLLRAEAAGVYRIEAESGDLVVLAISGPADRAASWNARLPAGHGVVGLALRERCAVITSDALADPRITLTSEARACVMAGQHRAVLAMPLVARDRLIGGLSIIDREGRVFDDEDVQLAQAFAHQAAVALENARLFDEAARQAQRMAALADVERLLSETLDSDVVAQRIVNSVCRLLAARSAALYSLAAESGELTAVTISRDVGASFHWTRHLPAGHGLVGLAVGQRRPAVTTDVLADSRLRYAPEARAAIADATHRALLAVPLRVRDRVLGALAVGRETGRAFAEEEIRLAQAFADQAAIAIQNAGLFETVEVRAARLRTLASVNRLVSSSLDSSEVLAAIARAATELIGAPFVTFWVADEVAGRLTLSGFSDHQLVRDFPLRTLAFGEGVAGLVAAERRVIDVPDIAADDRFVTREWALGHGLSSFRVLPIVQHGALLGVLSMGGRAPFQFTADEQDLLESFVAQAGIALDHARLYAETRGRLEETRALLEVAEILNSTLDQRQLLKRVAIKTAQVCRVDRCSLQRWDGDNVVPLMSQFADGHRDPAMWSAFIGMRPQSPREVPAQARAVETRRPVIIEDATTTDLLPREWIESFGHKSYMVVPLIRQDQVIGVLTLDHVERITPFQRWQIDLATAIAGQLALALENTRLYTEAQERLRETTTLLAVSRALSSTLELDPLLRQVMRQIAHATDADCVGIWMLDESGEWLAPVAGYRVPRPEEARRLRLSIVRHAFYAEAARAGRPLFSRDVASDPRIGGELFAEFPHKSQLFAPVLAKDRMIGGFLTVWWERPRDFTEGELALIEAMASQAGVAIENARLFQENRRRVEELSVLNELSRAVTGQLDRHALLDTLRMTVVRMVDAQEIVVLLLDEKTDEFDVALRVIDGGVDETPPRRYPRSVGLASVVLDTGRAIRTDDYGAECARLGLAPLAAVGPRHWVGAPLRAGASVLGVLVACRGDRPFTGDDERLLVSIADLATLALRSARLFEERTRAYGELAAAQDHLVRTEKLRALGEMASGVAHDFNNLLAAILGRTQLVLRQVTDPKLRRWLGVVERSALDGAQTVRRLQDLARVRRDQPKVAVSINDVVRDALDLTQARWREDALGRGVSLDVRTALLPVPPVDGDPAELREAMTNLILNAIDAMPGGGTLTLATAVVDGQVEVQVADTGTGIAPEVREKIFDPFFTTKGPLGTGLGLAMTYGIVARHGGALAVESEPGRGSIFRIRLPATAGPAASAPPGAATVPGAGGLRCLVVDDEEAVGAVLGDILESLGHSAVVLVDGDCAIERFCAEGFDVVFTDLAMPGVSGWQVATAVKAAAPDVPVYVVTGVGVELTAEERRHHGVDAVFSKPLKIEDITEAMARAARARGTTTRAEDQDALSTPDPRAP